MGVGARGQLGKFLFLSRTGEGASSGACGWGVCELEGVCESRRPPGGVCESRRRCAPGAGRGLFQPPGGSLLGALVGGPAS